MHAPINVSTLSSLNTSSLPIDLLPPVNTSSLREIDIQEIFKNPQLRHDIVFDPQLQFRPNLDGERGKRKRASTEKYWDNIVAELDTLATSASSYSLLSESKLPYLFISMRDILDSLLPVKDRAYVDSVLDPDLLLRQLRHCALDFVALANWLSSVFKAHCAPMRDSWVDQMVARIQAGVQATDARRIVEGLRMTFAILEAMKLDVANHQIRTLRPVLVDTAIEFEQGYYQQIIEKGKFNLHHSLVWYTKSLAKYKLTPHYSLVTKPSEVHRSAFCYGLSMLLSCASDDIVTEFPSSFGFDFTRMADFRAELRQIVCMHLCVTLFQQLLQPRLSRTHSNMRSSSALSPTAIEKLKGDLLAIIADPYGNTKWTKNTSTLALELASRVELVTTSSMVPHPDLVDMASGWLSKHLQPKSPVYKLVESKVIMALFGLACKSMNALSALDQPLSLSTVTPLSSTPARPSTLVGGAKLSVESAAQREIDSLAAKLLVLTRFHWGVFGKYYVSHATLGDSSEQYSSSSSSLSDIQSNSGNGGNNKSSSHAAAQQIIPTPQSASDNNEIKL